MSGYRGPSIVSETAFFMVVGFMAVVVIGIGVLFFKEKK